MKRSVFVSSSCLLFGLSSFGCGQRTVSETPSPQSVESEASTPRTRTTQGCEAADLTPDDATSVASVGKSVITGAELRAAIGGEEESARREYCSRIAELHRNALSQLIEDELLEQAAKRSGQTPARYLDGHLSAAVKKATREELLDFYQRNARDDAPPFEEVKGEIEALFVEQRESDAREELLRNLKKESTVERTLADVSPPPRKFEIPASAPSWGSENAPLTLIEFSDFECPYCAQAGETTARLKERYPSQLRIVFWHFPLSFHENAEPAAVVAQCAAAQGKFWPVHDLIFENQEKMSSVDLLEYAKDAGVDIESLQACLDKGDAASEVESIIKRAEELGIDATPTMFLNGRSVSNDFGEISASIDAALASTD